MILLDMVGDRDLAIGRESLSRHALWKQARTAVRRVGVASFFTDSTVVSVLDDHVPFLEQGVPALGLIDSDFGCWHRRCDDLRAVSPRSLDAVGETIYELLRSF